MKKVTIFSGRALEDELSKIHTVLNNSQADWKQRVENLSMVRALLVAGAAQFDELTGCLKSLEYPFESCVKDLRSQVVRECCITIAFLSQCLRNKVGSDLNFCFSLIDKHLFYMKRKVFIFGFLLLPLHSSRPATSYL